MSDYITEKYYISDKPSPSIKKTGLSITYQVLSGSLILSVHEYFFNPRRNTTLIKVDTGLHRDRNTRT